MRLIFGVWFFVFSVFGSDLSEISTLQARFTQIIQNPNGSKLEYSGKIFAKSPQKVLWKYKKPINKNVYINKDFVIIDEPELEQAIFTNLKKEIDFLALLKKAKKVQTHQYETILFDTKYTLYTDNQQQLQKVKYQDEMDNSVTIYLQAVSVNTTIDDSVFGFEAPKYYDIIRK